MVTFSVIIPTYNRAYLIGNAIQSVINQTFSDWELIIVDDGSVDNTKEVIDAFIAADKRIKYYYKENGGQNSALNCGLAYAEGKYVAFLDSDDIWVETKLEKVLKKYQSDTEIGCVYHWIGKMIDNGQTVNRKSSLEGYVYKEVLIQGFMSAQIALSCRREYLNSIGNYDEQFRCYQDDDICFEISKRFKVGLIKEVLSLVGEGENRVTENLVERAEDYWKLIKKYEQDIINLCGINLMASKYLEAMTWYCRAKMWENAYNAKKSALRSANAFQVRIKINLVFIYEILKSASGYTTFMLWYNRKKRERKRK